jgi:hypothetical protein
VLKDAEVVGELSNKDADAVLEVADATLICLVDDALGSTEEAHTPVWCGYDPPSRIPITKSAV